MLDLLVDPLLESLSQDGRANVYQPLLWDLWKINIIWKVGVNGGLVTDIQKDLLDRQVLVLRHVQRFDPVVLDISLSPGDDVLRKVYSDVLYMDHSVKGHEREHLP